MPDQDSRIHLENVHKRYDSESPQKFTLSDISLSVSRGRVLSILGKSGCGKSTLLNLISGILKPDSGVLRTNGSIGYATQKDLLLPWRTILENLLLPIEIKRGVNQETINKALKILHEVGLLESQSKYPDQLSGGMRQRASLARTLLQDSDILLLDEPFSAVDYEARLRLAKNFRSRIVGSDKAALFVTHNIEEAIAISDSVIVFGNDPAEVTLRSDIVIEESHRDPVSLRKTTEFENLFETIWEKMNVER